MRENEKKVKKIMMTIAIMMVMLLGMMVTENEAANETNTTTQNAAKTQTNENTTKQTNNSMNSATENKNKTVEKSSNANLSNLGIKPHDFTGFKYGKTSYEVSVPEETDTVEVYATAQEAKAKITGTGKKTLKKGNNTIQVIVTAENGTQKTYTLNITREESKEEKEKDRQTEVKEEVEKQDGKGLAELKINNLNLVPEFNTNVYEYTMKYIGEDLKLNIETKATQEDYVVEIVGNNNLQEGENIITILVSEKNGENIATYQITVNKSLVDEEAIAKEEAEKKAKQQKIMIGTAVGVVLLIIVIMVIIIRRRNRNIAEEFSGIGFYEDNEDEEEMPRALKDIDDQEDEIEEFEEEEDFDNMSKDSLKEKYLNGYTSRK